MESVLSTFFPRVEPAASKEPVKAQCLASLILPLLSDIHICHFDLFIALFKPVA